MTKDGDALAIVTLLAVPGVGPAKVTKALTRARRMGLALPEFLKAPEMAGLLAPEQVGGIETAARRASDLSSQVEGMGAGLVAITDERYPRALRERLGDGAPPLLTLLGDPSLLDAPGVGFCGSRTASEKGLATGRDCAEQLARAGVNVISGYAAGVDMSAHHAALDAGGSTIVVLAEGTLRFNVKREIKAVWDPKRVVVVSEFLPDASWSVHNAMRRNRTICGLSQAMVLIEARARGGSLEAGKACLDLGIPLFVAVYEGMPESAEGNRQLLRDGARSLFKSRSAGRANLAPVLRALGVGGTAAAFDATSPAAKRAAR